MGFCDPVVTETMKCRFHALRKHSNNPLMEKCIPCAGGCAIISWLIVHVIMDIPLCTVFSVITCPVSHGQKNRFSTSIALLLDFRERAALHDSIPNRIILLHAFCRVTHLCFRVLVKTPRSQCHPLHFCTCRNVPCWRLYNAISAHWPFLGGVTL